MTTALVVYQSKTGITKRLGEEIAHYLTGKGVNVQVTPAADFKQGMEQNASLVFLGCWTAGMMLMFQHPDKAWKQMATGMKFEGDKKVVLFTTYKIATGRMFSSMLNYLPGVKAAACIKSRNGSLSSAHRGELDALLA